MHYYQFNIGDYRADTAHLSILEHGIYRQLIDWYYLDEKPIPKETQVVMRRLRLGSDEVHLLTNVLTDFFVLTDSGYFHSRIEKELEHYRVQFAKNRVNGQLGGRPRKPIDTSNKTQVVLDNNHVATENNPSAPLTNNQEPITNNQEPVGGGGRVIELKIANPPPPTEFTYSSQKFSMHGEWTPSDSFETLAKIAGMKLGDDYPVDEFLEFRTYWVTQPAMQRTQGEWEHSFIKSYKTKQLKGVKK
jgi:uncharacterized protein YdaU (DUF1376 family)